MRNTDFPIDIVVPWVDGSDPAWLSEKHAYSGETDAAAAAGDFRYRDWGLMRYWFRGIDRFMPWVRTIHFVTWGHLPEWLDSSHPRLHIVSHRDYIPEEYLPTFNSNVIELHCHRIEGLAEHFVLFNDDMFAIGPTTRGDFFTGGGLPRAAAVLTPVDLDWGSTFLCPIINCSLLNKYFDLRRCVAGHPLKWLNPRYGAVNILRTLFMLPWPRITGFKEFHMPNSYLRKNFEKLWELEPEYLDRVSRHRLRELSDLSHWVVEGWQFLTGEFAPRSPRLGRISHMSEADFAGSLEKAVRLVRTQESRLICINDAYLSPEHFERARTELTASFETILPDPSSFEKGS